MASPVLAVILAGALLPPGGPLAEVATGPTFPAIVAERTLESAVLQEINAARADPPAYARKLIAYRATIHGLVSRTADDPVGHLTTEGAAPVDEAIGFMERQAPLPPLRPSPLLARAALAHVLEQGPAGQIGHLGVTGRTLRQRLNGVGGVGFAGEVISYGFADPGAVVREFVVDDGVPGRGHRQLLFDPRFVYAGAGCGPHAAYRAMCVVDLSSSEPGR